MFVSARPLTHLVNTSRTSLRLVATSRRGFVATSAAMSGEKITFGNNLPGYVFGNVESPGVVVLQEWWGITDIIKGHAQKIADQGYRCIVPDLYKGKIGVDKEEASHLMDNLDFQAAVGEVQAAVDYLKATGAKKVGITGFCMGGALSAAAAEHCGVACAAPFYGLPAPQICTPENIKVPIELHFGRLDEYKGFSDVESGEAFAKRANDAGGSATLFVYEQCGHAFLNHGPEAVAKRQHMGFPEPPQEQQDQAWERLFALFEKNLKA